MKKCSKCKINKKESEFYRVSFSTAGNGLRHLCKTCFYEYTKLHRKIPEVKFRKYSENARARGLDFSLSFKDFMCFWEKDCSYCGDKIETLGLDRVDNKKGYIVGNVIACCSVCNKLKGTMSSKDFINQCEKISNHF